jgi:hypothetical protein
LKRSFKLYRSACEARLGYRFIDGAAGKSGEGDREQARAQQHKSGCGYRQKSIGDEVVVTHDAPATFDDGPTLLKISESACRCWRRLGLGPGTIGLKSVRQENAGAE